MVTRNRADLLRSVLDSLCRQTLDEVSYEIVVVDDGSEDDTRSVVREFESRARVRYSRQRHAGQACAKNHGIFVAQGQILLFLHDDEVADVRLFEAHCRAHHRFRKHRCGILGSEQLAPALAVDPLMRFVTGERGCRFSSPHRGDECPLDFRHMGRGRASFERAFLVEQGVFSSRLGFGCEDAELALRLSGKGLRLVHERRAVTTVVRKVGLDDLCERRYEEGRSCWVFSHMHPEPAVQEWTEVAGALQAWREIEPAYADVLGNARGLDRGVREKLEARVPIADSEWDALHQSYLAVARASKAKGIANRARQRDE